MEHKKRFKSSAAWSVSVYVVIKDGKPALYVNKSYKDQSTGEYKQTDMLFPNEAIVLPELISRAMAWIDSVLAEEREPQRQSGFTHTVPSDTGEDIQVSFKDDDIPF